MNIENIQKKINLKKSILQQTLKTTHKTLILVINIDKINIEYKFKQ